ncbi:pilus assembly FimT family protein [Desulfocurvus sp. DL9XJH121]
MTTRTPHTPGFTILELITVIVLMGILSAALAISANTDTDLGEQTDLLKSRIRYAQARAMGGNTAFGVSCNGNSYFLFAGISTSNQKIFPAEDDEVVSLPSGVTVSSFVVSFDEWGVPYSDAGQSTGLANTLSITLSTDEASATVAVTPITGFVP